MARFAALDAWLNWQEQLHPRSIDMGLERVADLYRQLGLQPNKQLTITVAGTNGKGSCIAYLEAIYRAQGYKVGAYTSPHILRYNERIRINGESVSDEAICTAFSKVDSLRGDTTLSYFEFGTLAALYLFAAADLDVQLLEVGMGGRLDAVNIVDPNVALLTTIAIDHVDWLGHTLEAIGKEKAGIFRPHTPAVVGDAEAPDSVLQCAAEKQALLMQLGSAYSYCKRVSSWDWQAGDCQLMDLPLPAFKGEHQFRNASAVLMAVQALQAVLPVNQSAICQGLKSAHLKGRFQLIPGNVPVLLDVGHNPQAVSTLINFLQEQYATVTIHAVFAMMKDKDIATVLAMMDPLVASWYLAPLKNPRAADINLLQNLFQQQQIKRFTADYSDFLGAFTAARNAARPGELILVFGSFFLVSEYLSTFPQG